MFATAAIDTVLYTYFCYDDLASATSLADHIHLMRFAAEQAAESQPLRCNHNVKTMLQKSPP